MAAAASQFLTGYVVLFRRGTLMTSKTSGTEQGVMTASTLSYVHMEIVRAPELNQMNESPRVMAEKAETASNGVFLPGQFRPGLADSGISALDAPPAKRSLRARRS